MRFLESFLLYSLLLPSPPYGDNEQTEIKQNMNAVALNGRDPNLRLSKSGDDILLRDWAKQIFDEMSLGCDLLDLRDETPIYCSALQQQRAKIENPDLTPSARMLAEMIENKEEFFEFSLRKSMQHKQWFSRETVRSRAVSSIPGSRKSVHRSSTPD